MNVRKLGAYKTVTKEFTAEGKPFTIEGTQWLLDGSMYVPPMIIEGGHYIIVIKYDGHIVDFHTSTCGAPRGDIVDICENTIKEFVSSMSIQSYFPRLRQLFT